MARCLKCGNESRFNVWCSIQKVLEVELDPQEEVVEIVGEPEDEHLQQMEDIHLLEGDLAFSMVSCAVCGSRQIVLNNRDEILTLRVHH